MLKHDGLWWIRDAGSRNGTLVNDQKVDEARLIDGVRLKVGGSEFTFHESASKPGAAVGMDHTQTIVRDQFVQSSDTGSFGVASLKDSDRANDLLTLHQLSLRLLGCSDPDEVIHDSLDLLQLRTQAAVVGFLWVSDDGQLKPKLVMPEESGPQVQLSDDLTEMVSRQESGLGRQPTGDGGSSGAKHFADAICVPMLHEGPKRSALMHLYKERDRFQHERLRRRHSSGQHPDGRR